MEFLLVSNCETFYIYVKRKTELEVQLDKLKKKDITHLDYLYFCNIIK